MHRGPWEQGSCGIGLLGYPLGASQPRHVQFKLIAATNRDLRAEVAAGRFRQELFYRVSVTTLRIPALRERKEDIAELVEHFNREVSHRHGVSVKRFEANVIDAFERYGWPGNVREMRNVVEGMVMLADDDTVTAAQHPEEMAFLGAGAGDTPHVSAESAHQGAGPRRAPARSRSGRDPAAQPRAPRGDALPPRPDLQGRRPHRV